MMFWKSVQQSNKKQLFILCFLLTLFALYEDQASFFSADFSADFDLDLVTGLDLPNDPIKIFPFLVFLSPRPISMMFLLKDY